MDGIVARLQHLQITHETVLHSCVMTCDEQAEALRGVPGAITKNLFLKDKKGRLYIITALRSTKVDLKVLSARLGLGKGGLRLAPDELIAPILGVPLGSVTPLALGQPSAAGVVLLLDGGLRSQARFFVHPLVNTASTALTASGLEAFLGSLGQEAVYVDLQAAPQIDKDTPPDLKHIADAAAPLVGGDDAAAIAKAGAAAAPVPRPPPPSSRAESKPSGGASNSGTPPPPPPPPPQHAQRPHDVNAVTDSIVAMVAEQLLGAEGAAALEAGALRRLTADVAMRLNALRNASYAAGFKASQGAVAASLNP